MKKLSIVYEELDHLKLGKPQIMYPTYMNYFGWDTEVVTYNLKNDLPNEIRRVKLTKLKQPLPFLPNLNLFKFIKRVSIYYYVYKNAKKIDVMMLYHLTKCSYWNTLFYKLGNPQGKVFIKGDFDFPEFQEEVEWLTKQPKSMREFFKKRRWVKEFKKRLKLVNMMDVFSVEPSDAYEGLLKHGYAGLDVSKKLLHIPNGFDERLAKELGIKRKPYKEKENLIFTACRLGTKEKNTEFFLEVLKNIDLKNWKVKLAGPITEEFKPKIEGFFKEFPHLKEKVEFLGYIGDKRELYEYHNSSKVFMMTSRGESFANVFLEAMYFGEHIVVTKVSGAEDLTNKQSSGKVIEQGDLEGYSKYIQDVIDGRIDLEDKNKKTVEYSEKFLWERSVGILRDRLEKVIN